MVIGDRLRELREQKQMSQGDIEKRTGLLRCYISRVENGHTVPAVETLEKFARALEVPMYQLFYIRDDESPSIEPAKGTLWGSSGKDAQLLAQFCKTFRQLNTRDLELLLHTAQKIAKGKEHSSSCYLVQGFAEISYLF